MKVGRRQVSFAQRGPLQPCAPESGVRKADVVEVATAKVDVLEAGSVQVNSFARGLLDSFSAAADRLVRGVQGLVVKLPREGIGQQRFNRDLLWAYGFVT